MKTVTFQVLVMPDERNILPVTDQPASAILTHCMTPVPNANSTRAVSLSKIVSVCCWVPDSTPFATLMISTITLSLPSTTLSLSPVSAIFTQVVHDDIRAVVKT